MNLGKFLEQAGQYPPAPIKAVRFKVLATDPTEGVKKLIDVSATMVCITEKERQDALKAALKAVKDQYPDGNWSSQAYNDEEIYHLLAAALRDDEDPKLPFATATQLRGYLTKDVAEELWTQWGEFLKSEFPSLLTPEEFSKLVEEARGKSLGALLSSFDSSKILRALPGLVAVFAKSQMQTSGDGVPA